MQKAAFLGFCPYEIGDKIMFKAFGGIQTIIDIRAINYLLSGQTEFEVKVKEHDTEWMPLGTILKRIIEEE